ncbi:dolichol phosphate-mannose biosynthesis regulatory [Naematelia encephala]|uniref:Dolichol phosphate-mannose biosynthesis regulatory protein n=1 Tax=Naematelia encephala TaxID=71784 RepID=A0A1Y2B8D1_9TREE|nr:dolichol phosphate-mannose biosynthesis regulatory [Naematelia encephala]
MATSDKLLGGLMLLTAIFVFVYYTTWALLLPFLPDSSPLQPLFPPREYVIRIPLFILVSGLVGIGLFFGRIMLSEARRRSGAGKKV